MPPRDAAGIWTPGGVSSDGTSLFAVTGNTEGAAVYSDGNGVFKFQSGPVFTSTAANYFAPSQWKQYDDDDIDLCGSEPVILDLPGDSKLGLIKCAVMIQDSRPVHLASRAHRLRQRAQRATASCSVVTRRRAAISADTSGREGRQRLDPQPHQSRRHRRTAVREAGLHVGARLLQCLMASHL